MNCSDERYKQRLDWLFQQYPAFQKVGEKAYKPTLDNTRQLIQKFDINLNTMRFIHVAGTNGKGTTASIMASDLKESGFKTGLFTSPHLSDFRERIRVNGQMIDHQTVCDFIDVVQQKDFQIAPSFFEISWVLALKYFESKSCDIVVVETGLGGRLDATNVIAPLLSVITNIGLDHTAILGETFSEIAYEKAGIIKRGVPVVIGEKHRATDPVFDQVSEQRNAPLIYVDQPSRATTFELNQSTAREALKILPLKGYQFDVVRFERAIRQLTENTGFTGRFQVLQNDPVVVLDAAHNEEGIKRLVKDIEHVYYDKKVHAIYGASNDKKLDQLLKLIPDDWSMYFTIFKNKRSMKLITLKSAARKNKFKSKFFKTPHDALKSAQHVVNKEDIIVVFGSFFLLEEII